MDRKTLLAFALIAIVLILTPWYMNLFAPTPSSDPRASGADKANIAEKIADPVVDFPTPPSKNKNKPQKIEIDNGIYSATLSNRAGGSFSSFVLV